MVADVAERSAGPQRYSAEPGHRSDDRTAAQDIAAVLEQCRTLYTHPLFTTRTQDAYMQMLREEAKHGNIARLRENVHCLARTLDEAREYATDFQRALDEAVEKKWISAASRGRWLARFHHPDVLEWVRKMWIREHFPAFRERWKAAAEERTRVLGEAQRKGITAQDVPILALLQDDEEFLGRDYHARLDLLAKVRSALVAAGNGLTALHDSLKEELTALTRGTDRCLHSNKVGRWLERVFTQCRSVQEVRVYRRTILDPHIARWRDARAKFDELEHDLRARGVPRGFQPVSLDAFLWWSYQQRMCYLQEARFRLEDRTELNEQLRDLKLRIRHDIDTEDWDGAEEDLACAQAIAPFDSELLSMAAFLRAHRPSAGTEQYPAVADPQAIVDDLRTIVQALPMRLQWMYEQAFVAGSDVAFRLLQVMYNRVWVHEHGHMTIEKEWQQGSDARNKETTRFYARHGHSQKREENILDGDTAVSAAINDNPTKPQGLHVSRLGDTAVLEKVRRNALNERFGYWTTCYLADVPYGVHHFVVKNLHHHMKRGIRQLKHLGYGYTAFGSAERQSVGPKPSAN